MCTALFSATEVVVIGSAAAVVTGESVLFRLRAWWTGSGTYARWAASYDADRDFVTALGLDPYMVLGAPPELDGAERSAAGVAFA